MMPALQDFTPAPELRRRRASVLAELAQLDRQIVASDLRAQRLQTERAMAAAAAQCVTFRDGSPKDSAAHREIARRYAWGSRKAPRSSTGSRDKLMTLIRLRELERLISARHGGVLPDSRAGRNLATAVLHHVVQLGGDAEQHVIDWLRLWAPWADDARVRQLAAGVLMRPVKFRADTLAWRVGLTVRHQRLMDRSG